MEEEKRLRVYQPSRLVRAAAVVKLRIND